MGNHRKVLKDLPTCVKKAGVEWRQVIITIIHTKRTTGHYSTCGIGTEVRQCIQEVEAKMTEGNWFGKGGSLKMTKQLNCKDLFRLQLFFLDFSRMKGHCALLGLHLCPVHGSLGLLLTSAGTFLPSRPWLCPHSPGCVCPRRKHL